MSAIQDKQFMQLFWDLAVEDAALRVAAASKIASVDIPESYRSYTLKRLVKGLTSPRDQARLGFASALTMFLENHKPDPQEVLTLIDEHTRITGALKGFEERDNMFGKLFGLLALIRSGIVSDNELCILEVVKRLIDLYRRKTWMQELSIEAMLDILFVTTEKIQLKIAPKLAELCNSSLEEQSENELLLRIALQSFAKRSSKNVTQAIYGVMSVDNDFSLAHLSDVKSALFRSANKFPKVHRVWDYLLTFIFAVGEDRELLPKSVLTAADQENLQLIVSFMEENMFHFSKEKKALAMKLSIKLLYLVPADSIPSIFTEKLVRSLYLSRLHAKSTLFEFAGTLVTEIQTFAKDNQQRILALLSLIAEYGYINFDKAAGVKFVQQLIHEMTEDSAQQLLKILCANIGDSADAVDTAVKEEKEEADGEEDDAIEQKSFRRNRAVAAVSLFTELGKHLSTSVRVQLSPVLLNVLTRLACFTSGTTAAVNASSSSAKKDTKKGKKDTPKRAAQVVEVAPELLTTSECVAIIESSASLREDGPSNEVQEQATVALLALVHDLKSLVAPTKHQQQQQLDAAQQLAQKKASHLTELRVFTLWNQSFRHFVQSQLSNKHIDSERLSLEQLTDLATAIDSVLRMLQQELSEDNQQQGHKLENFLRALLSVVVNGSIHALTSEEVDVDVVTRTSEAALQIIMQQQLRQESQKSSNMEVVDSDDEEDDEDNDAQLNLLDCSVEFLSVSADQAIKGLRDAIKRLWSAVLTLVPEESLSQQCLDVLVDVVMATADNKEDDEEDNEHDHEDDEEEEGSESEQLTTSTAAKKGGKAVEKKNTKTTKAEKADRNSQKKGTSQTVEDEEDEEEDVMIGEDDFMDFMMVDDEAFRAHVMQGKSGYDDDEDSADSDSDEDDKGAEEETEEDDAEGALVHTAEADDALGAFIRLKQESRKAGVLALHRKQILLRSRVLDILETFVERVKSGPLLFSLLHPLVVGARKAIRSKILRTINEGKTLVQRILNLLGQVSKKKIAIKVSSQEGLAEEFLAEIADLESTLLPMMNSKLLPMRQVAQEIVILLTRIVIASDSEEAKTQILAFIASLVRHQGLKRRSLIPAKFLEDLLVQRFPDFTLPSLLAVLLETLVTSKVLFTKGETSETLASVFKRYALLQPATQTIVQMHSSQLLATMAQIVETALANSNNNSDNNKTSKNNATASAKRLRPILQHLKSIVESVLRTPSSSATKGSQQQQQQSAPLLAHIRSNDLQKLLAVVQSTAATSSSASKLFEEIAALAQNALEAQKSVGSSALVSESAVDNKNNSKDKKGSAKKGGAVVAAPVEAKTEKIQKDSKKRKAAEVEAEVVTAVEEEKEVAVDEKKQSTKKSKKVKA